MEKRPNPPGQHGQRMSRKMSDYGRHLLEKQRFRYTYGLLEKQFRNYVKKAMARTGVSGDNLLQMLETRLDSVIYRAGFTNTMSEARQLVTHKHIMVDGKCINVPSYQVKPGMKIQVSEKMQNNAQIRGTVGKSANQTVPYRVHPLPGTPVLRLPGGYSASGPEHRAQRTACPRHNPCFA